MDLTIRSARDEDLPGLIAQLGQRFYFRERLLRQLDDRGRLFIALVAGRFVGDIFVSLEIADEPELQKHLSDVRLLQHLEVRNGFRNQGIGKLLITAAEEFLVERDHRQVALGVDLGNEDAIRLYRQLGYYEWELSPTTTFREHYDPEGGIRKEPEQCRIFIKNLPLRPSEAE